MQVIYKPKQNIYCLKQKTGNLGSKTSPYSLKKLVKGTLMASPLFLDSYFFSFVTQHLLVDVNVLLAWREVALSPQFFGSLFEGLPGVLGNKGTLAKYRREQGKIGKISKGTREHRQNIEGNKKH